MSTSKHTPESADHTEAHALLMDRADAGLPLRDRFAVPRIRDVLPRGVAVSPGLDTDQPCVYLCGNSLGLMPLATQSALTQELADWSRLGVEGHFHAEHPWLSAHESVRGMLARLVGAREHEVVAMNSLSVNLHLMMTSFYRPGLDQAGKRIRIMIEDAAFPSDSYAVQSQVALHGLDPGDSAKSSGGNIVRIKPRAGEHTLRTQDIIDYLRSDLGQRVALVMLSGVNYLTGQVFDMPAITAAGHTAGAMVGWDLAHAAGNIELRLHDWNADFACWCSYKYLNSGPGAIAGCFVHERHTARTGGFGSKDFLPRLAGWWGNDPASRFVMGPDFVPVASADAWQLSNPPILALTPLRASLELFDGAGMVALAAKGRAMSRYLRGLIEQTITETSQRSASGLPTLEIITPELEAEGVTRPCHALYSAGCQLSLLVRERPREFHRALAERGVVCDYREPGVIRVAPVPLYNTFHDCWRFAEILRDHLGQS